MTMVHFLTIHSVEWRNQFITITINSYHEGMVEEGWLWCNHFCGDGFIGTIFRCQSQLGGGSRCHPCTTGHKWKHPKCLAKVGHDAAGIVWRWSAKITVHSAASGVFCRWSQLQMMIGAIAQCAVVIVAMVPNEWYDSSFSGSVWFRQPLLCLNFGSYDGCCYWCGYSW